MKVYLVGGAVRDELLGYPIKERDYVVVGASPEEMLAKGFTLVGQDFPVFLHPESHEEYALARIERKTGPGYKGFSCYASPEVTLEEDLQRRDLTINAMAKTLDGDIIDPYKGQEDIAQHCLRHVSPAFSEDPVRILRVARFMARYASLGFHVAEETLELMKTIVNNGELKFLKPERVWKEFSLALKEPTPQAFIKTLYQCGALASLFPDLERFYKQSQQVVTESKQRKPNSYLSVVEKAAELTSDPQVRFAALFCAFGKEAGMDKISSAAERVRRIQALCDYYGIPKSYISLAILAAAYHLVSHRALELDASALLNFLEKIDAFRRFRRLEQFLLVCESDYHAYFGLENKVYLQKERILLALSVAKKVAIDKIIHKGHTGIEIKRNLHEQRINAIAQWLHELQSKTYKQIE